jgi:hypothetical protein
MAVGIHRPVILLPDHLLDQLSEEELSQILVHEMAHLRRGDDWTNLAQKLIEAVLFFHPAVWWIGRLLNLEREIACDDWVVSLTGKARPYAACLTHLVELNLSARSPQLAHGAAGRKWQITRRVEALLSGRRSLSPAFSRTWLLAGCGVLAAAVGLAGRLEPVAVAEPPLEALAAPIAGVPAVAMAYALPPAPVPAHAESVPQGLPVASVRQRPAFRYVLIQEWTVAAPRDPAAAFCVFYFRGAGQVVTILWRRPAPVLVSIHRA